MALPSSNQAPRRIPDLPILIRPRDHNNSSSTALLSPLSDIKAFLTSELDITRLNAMLPRGLWLAGRLGNIRPLHRQKLLGRRIVVTEQMDLHLLWKGNVIFVKPLPDWIVDEDFLRRYIGDKEGDSGGMGGLEQVVNGFLGTYAKLINYRSDFRIAKEEGLLPEGMEWEDWQALGEKRLVRLLNDMAAGKKRCAPTFRFGELRLSRVNMIYRFHPAYGLKHVVRGYHYGDRTYQSFLRRNFTWVAVVFAYLTIVLTAMQVGLGTSQLRGNGPFNSASYGFTVFAILLPVAALFVGMIVSLVLTVYHVQATRRHLRECAKPTTVPIKLGDV